MLPKIVICSGGFDPIHEGHIEYFKEAKRLGDKLIIALNSDEWLTRKKGKPFMTWETRSKIIKEFKSVDEVISFNDNDDSARDALDKVSKQYPGSKILFVNGGDRSKVNIPEVTEEYVEFVFDVGGDCKTNSSSWILDDWKKWILRDNHEYTERLWGWYEVINKVSPQIKVKKLVVKPGKALSYQRHYFRNEFWIVQEGIADVLIQGKHIVLQESEFVIINKEEWHQIQNKTEKDLIVFEVQFGSYCNEEDIERI